jgi:hypothetical protein
MKLIFCDIDGTLIPLPPVGISPDWPNPSELAVENLNILVQATGAKVVVSSTWRFGRSVKELDAILKSWGATFLVHDKLPTNDDEDRGGDVLSFVESAGAENFVVLDDEPVDLEIVSKNTVLVNPQKALQMHDVEEAVKILRRER